MLRALALASLVVLAPCGCSCGAPATQGPPPPPPHGLSFPTYHFDAARTGWNDAEPTLAPSRVSAGLVRAWTTAPLDIVTLTYQDSTGASQTTTFPPRLFASPLYLDDVTFTAGPLSGVSTSVVLAATTNDWIYAIAAVDTAAAAGLVHAGSVLWQTSLGTPAYVPTLDGGTPLGVLSTPVIDLTASPPTLYVAAIDATAGWQVFAVDVTSGRVLPGWPVQVGQDVVAAANQNLDPDAGATAAMSAAIVQSQRAALALAGGKLYVGYGSYYDEGIGWIVAIDVDARKVAHSFSGSRTNPSPTPSDPTNVASGGMWGAGGPAIASDGRLFVTTGNSPATSLSTPGVWGNSVLAWNPDLTLSATYTPFNYCLMDAGDIDLAGSSPVVFDVDPSLTSTPHLATFGGKQGVVYLVDREHLGGSTVARQACDPNVANDDPSSDASLYAPTPLAQYTPPRPGPLSVFGPYSDKAGDNSVDRAKMRTTPALYRPSAGGLGGGVFVYFAGTSRDPSDLASVVPPCLVRMRVHLSAGAPAYLETDATNPVTTFKNPGSPVVTSHDGGQAAMVWILDQNATRTDPVLPKPGYTPAGAILYAFDASTMVMAWQSAPGDLGPSGKYGHVVVAHGVVFAGTDRVAAFVPR